MSKKTEEIPNITARSWVIFEASNAKFLYGKFPHYKREIASLTKIMTCYTALMLIEKWEIDPKLLYFTVSREAYQIGGTSAELQDGDLISLEDLFYGLMLPSGNDAAYTMGEYFGFFLYLEQLGKGYQIKEFRDLNIKKDFGGVKDPMRYFISEMNDIASDLNLTQTFFNNVHGMSIKINISCAYDVALLTCRAIKKLEFLKICKTTAYITKVWSKDRGFKELYWENTNKLLDHGFEGVKTGATPNAGPCLSALYKIKRDFHETALIVVVLNCEGQENRFTDVKKIVNWCKDITFK